MSASACIVSVVRPALDVRTFHKEARSLAAAGWDVTVIGRDPGPARIVDGIRILPLPAARGAARAVAQVRALRMALGTRADVFHVADLELLPAALLLKRTRRPVVYDCIEDYPAYMHLKPWLPPRARRPAAAAVAALERFVVARLDAVLTADEGTAERLRRHQPATVVLHNFPRAGDFAPAPPEAPRPVDVLYHGSLPAYHLRALVEIGTALARRVPAFRCSIVGEPDSVHAWGEFAEGLARGGLNGRMTLRPRVPFRDVPALVRLAHTAVVPLPDVAKFRTNVPMKLFEYMAAGVPTVTSDLPPVRGLLGGSDGAMLVPPGDHGAFADALANLLCDRDAAAAVGRRGVDLVRERFHWEREEAMLLRVYGDLLCGPGVASLAAEMHA
jgi:glycosyltransferase involved in cell wall biosynthesis